MAAITIPTSASRSATVPCHVRAWRVVFALGAGACAGAACAQADCSAVIASYAKADATHRFAVYDADSMAQAPKGRPIQVEVGNQAVIDTGYGKEYMKIGGGTAASEGRSLAQAVTANEKSCESLGDGKVGDEAVTGYSIRRVSAGKDPLAIHFWVSKSTGLPMYHGMGAGAGLRWVYGPTVVMPAGAPK